MPSSSSVRDTVEVPFELAAPPLYVALLLEFTRLRVWRWGRLLVDRVCTALAVSLESFEVRMLAHEKSVAGEARSLWRGWTPDAKLAH